MHSPNPHKPSNTPCFFRTDKPQAAAPAPQPRHDTHLRRTADVATARIEWLWPGRIPIGKVTLLVGDPGLGKSLIALDLAARVSTGAAWPDEKVESRGQSVESQNSGPGPSSLNPRPLSGPRPSTLNPRPSSVLLLNSEDDLADTLRPRLEAQGADCNRVFVVDSVTDLRNDFDQLRAAVDRTPDCRLIIVDPVNAFVGANDSHFHTVVRKVLAPLAKLATQKRLAILAVTHLRKHEGAAIQRATGSMGFVAAARAVWTICRDPTNPGRKLFVPLKSNLAAEAKVLTYSIEPHPKFDAPVIRWHRGATPLSVEEALNPQRKPRGPQAEETRSAQDWLRKHLSGGRQAAHDVIDAGEERGFSGRTLRRALRMIGGETEKVGYLNGWWWCLPESPKDGGAADVGKLGHFPNNSATSSKPRGKEA
jgi:hypothetical protein